MKIYLSILFIICELGCYAQYNTNWVIGQGNGTPPAFNNGNLLFNNGSKIISNLFTQNKLSATSTCISDSSSNLLFYTNGQNIYNALGDTMDNGDNISPSSWNASQTQGLNIIQATVTVPVPGSLTEYYLIHQTIDTNIFISLSPYFIHYCSKLYYSVIDMSYNGGLGKVTEKNINFLPEFDTLAYGGLTCCRHANGRDWWLMSHAYTTNEYFAWLITPTAILGPYKQVIGPYLSYGMGQAKFSPDGTKYACVTEISTSGTQRDFYLFNFDRCSGLLSDSVHLSFSTPWIASGLEFSPNSKYLYGCSGNALFQWDTQAPDVQLSEILIDTVELFYDSVSASNHYGYFWIMEMAPDNKIYISTSSGTSILHCISDPDLGGIQCNFLQHSIQLPFYNFQTIPNHVNFALGRDSSSACDTLQWTTINEQQQDFEIFIYPNPVTSNSLSIGYHLLQNQAGFLSIYDVTGKAVFKSTLPQWSNEQVFNLPLLRGGVYNCVITFNGYRMGKKLVVMDN